MEKRKKLFLRILCVLLCLGLLGVGAIALLNGIVIGTTRSRILSTDEAAKLEDVEYILVLGCHVRSGGVPSHMLEDRLTVGVQLYDLGAAPKLLMSGDHGQTEYDEVNTMKQFAVDAGIPSSDVFMDHAGFSTYESMYRAKEVFQAEKIIIVTQEYHLYRALYIAESLGLEAYGVSAALRGYGGQLRYDVREALARVKDVFSCIFKPAPTYLGDAIPVSGDGNVTNDEYSLVYENAGIKRSRRCHYPCRQERMYSMSSSSSMV